MTEENQERLIEVTPPATRFERIAVEAIEYPEAALKPTPQLVDAIAQLGVLDPIRVEQKRRGQYIIKDGLRRVGAVRKLLAETGDDRWSEIPVIIEEPDAMTADVTRIVGHATRRDNPIVELEVIEHYHGKGYSENEISRVTKLPVGTIRKRMKLAGLSGMMREEVRSGNVAPSVGEKLAALPPSTQAELEERFEEKGKLTADDVRGATQAYHEENWQNSFEGLEPPEEEEEDYRTPEDPHEYAEALANFLVSMGWAPTVNAGDRSGKDGSLSIEHDDGVRFRLRVIAKARRKEADE